MGWKEKAKKALATGTARVLARAGWAGEKERAVKGRPGRARKNEKRKSARLRVSHVAPSKKSEGGDRPLIGLSPLGVKRLVEGGELIMKHIGVTLAVIALVACVAVGSAPVLAQNIVDFPGTVLKIDDVAGKLTVKKEGTRFTFVVDGRTRYVGVKALKEIKAGDTVTVSYIAMGGQYVAQKIAKK